MRHTGLTTTQVNELLREFGLNKIDENNRINWPKRILEQIFSILNVLLIFAAGVSYSIGHPQDAALIIAIVLLNAGISFWQEFKAERTLKELKKISHSFARVIRNGNEISIDSEQLVPGDIISLEAGDKIPADGLVIEALNLEVNESSLTGESASVYKKVNEPEHNHVFAGTLVAAGRAIVRITNTGNTTRFGKIAQTLNQINETETPLQQQIKSAALNLGLLAIVFCALIYVIGVATGKDKIEMFLTAVSAAVAAIPEGLPAIILITLAVGVKRMAQRRAIVRKMLAIEALGSVNVICTDKTGTLTKAEMRVAKIWFNHNVYSPSEIKRTHKHKAIEKLLDAMIVPNTAGLIFKFDHGSKVVLGDTTEGALLLFADELGIDYELHRQKGKIIDEFSFDQTLKRMSVVWEQNGSHEALIKGAPEYIIASSTRILEGEKIRLLTEADKQELLNALKAMNHDGLRGIGFAYKTNLGIHKKYSREDAEDDTIFLGFAGLQDPIRAEAYNAIKASKQAGIRTVMITGDNEITAMSIARQLGLAVEGDEAMLGKDLVKFTDEELAKIIAKVKVFARTNPEDKLRIVRAFQSLGLSVAVTGDGVNDALALKQAEVGVAMGKKGTEVAKEAADIVLTDDNYASLVAAIEEGRTIYSNVLTSIRYLVSTNVSELLTILIALILGLPSPLLPAQILWINLVSDGFPAVALALDPKDPNALKRMPRPRNQKLLDLNSIVKLLGIGLFVAGISFSTYWYVLNSSGNIVLARTWAFTMLIILQLGVAFIIRGRRSANMKLSLAVVLTLVIQFTILNVPQLHGIFHIQNLW